VAHEINSPLATIAVAARELEHDLLARANPAELVSDAKLIRAEVERCRRVLGRLRAASVVDGQEPDSFMQAGQLASDLRDTLPVAYADRLVPVIRAEAATCRVPREPLLQAVASLVRNAVEASPAGAPVELEVSRRNGTIAITVSDRGPGLAPAVARRVGEPFVTTKEPGQGTGLGLFLVRRFAEEVGWQFSIDSTPGTGTRARLELPVE
jgi:two-component system sensor histidine kinase RegB